MGNPETITSRRAMVDVKRIGESGGVLFFSEDQIPDFVEAPLVSPIVNLYRKGILTEHSSANIKNNQGEATIGINWKTLSAENREVARRLLNRKKVQISRRDGSVAFQMSINSNTNPDKITEWGIELSNIFHPQRAKWETRTPKKMMKAMLKKATLEGIQLDLTDEYLGPDGYYYESERHYKRYKGIFD